MSYTIGNEGSIVVSFNQNDKHVCFGTEIGFYIYSLSPFKKIISRKIDGGVSHVKMYYDTNIILFVGRANTHNKGLYQNNKLIYWDDSNSKIVGEITFNYKIVNIDVCQNYTIVTTERKIFIYDFKSMVLYKTIETAHNPRGLTSISNINNKEYEIFAYMGYNIGQINIISIGDSSGVCINKSIQAHINTIESFQLSKDGNYIATCSEKGTIIRIFQTSNGLQTNEFRRGADPTRITNLVFNNNNSILLVSSEKGTIHLFNTEIQPGFMIKNTEYNKYGIMYIRNYLPKYFNSKWSFSQYYLGIVCYSVIHGNKVYSIGYDGQYYEINFENHETPNIDRVIKFISDDNDPFSKRSTTIK